MLFILNSIFKTYRKVCPYAVMFWHGMCLCCTVEEVMNEFEANIRQKIDECLAEQHEIEVLIEG